MRWPAHPAAELFPLLGQDELRELADDIRTNGLHEPIWLYDTPEGRMVLDGRNRLAACELAGIAPQTRVYTGDDPITFSLSQNLKRRHLTTGQKAAVALEALPLYEAEAAVKKIEAGKEHGRGQQEKVGADLHQPMPEARAPRAAERAATVVGTSGRAVAQMKRVVEQAPDLAMKVKEGGLALDRAERIIRDRDAEQKRVEQARREAAAAEVPTTVDIRRGDFREVLADVTGVDAIITDPPYPREFIPLLADLAAWADKALTPAGVLAVLIGQSYLPEVYRLLDGHRDYRWTACYLTEGPSYVSHARRVHSNWKPLIVYGGGPRFADVFRGAGDTGKEHHKWGQDFTAFRLIVERLTEKGQTVVDPFMGAGTTLLAAHALGRNAIGCDTEAEHVETARGRLA